MRLVWKLLRRHVSVPQLLGYFLANLFGVFIVLLGYQFYRDVMPVFTGGDSFMKSEYLIVSKQMGTFSSSAAQGFSVSEIDDVEAQPFVKAVGAFTSAVYKVKATIYMDDTSLLSTEMPIESVPDAFVETPGDSWRWTPETADVPIILPRSYVTMYNFGFARSHSLPRISEGVVSMLHMQLHVSGHNQPLSGRVVGFSSRLNAILVPQAFMEWSNQKFANGAAEAPSRLLIDVQNPTDQRITPYLEEHGLELEAGNLDAEKTAYFLRLVVSLVMMVGLVISLLSFYILMLSIYLLVQKNASKLENLLLIGYAPSQVARPYQLLTILLGVAVLLLAVVLLWMARRYYMDTLYAVYPDLEEGSMLPAIALGIALMAVVTMMNYMAIHLKILTIWKHKD